MSRHTPDPMFITLPPLLATTPPTLTTSPPWFSTVPRMLMHSPPTRFSTRPSTFHILRGRLISEVWIRDGMMRRSTHFPPAGLTTRPCCLVTMAKLGGGVPISSPLTRSRLEDVSISSMI